MARPRPKEEAQKVSLGYFHIDLTEVRTAEGKPYLFVTVDRTSKFAFATLDEQANVVTASAFLGVLVKTIHYQINIVLLDDGIQFADLPKNRQGLCREHPFDPACRHHGIEHRLTKLAIL